MRIIDNEFTDVETPTGAMRTYLFRPRPEGRYPGVVLFTEIFQATHQMRRAAAMIAGHGFLVAVPEIFHAGLPAGRALPYSEEGRAQGLRLMAAKSWSDHDADAAAVLRMLRAHSKCAGGLGAVGFCFGGHLALRAALQAGVRACAAFYPTRLVEEGAEDSGACDTLERLPAANGELAFFVGTEDPLFPAPARRALLSRLAETGANYRWFEARAGHAYMRDGGAEFDPELARQGYEEVVSLLRRNLGA